MAEHTQLVEDPKKAPVIEPGHSFASVTDDISSIVLKRPITLGWVAGFFVAFMILQVLLFAVTTSLPRASGSGASTFRLAGDLPSSISSGGLVLAMPVR